MLEGETKEASELKAAIAYQLAMLVWHYSQANKP